MSHEPKGSPNGGRFSGKASVGGDDDLDDACAASTSPTWLRALMGGAAQPMEFTLPDGSVMRGWQDETDRMPDVLPDDVTVRHIVWSGDLDDPLRLTAAPTAGPFEDFGMVASTEPLPDGMEFGLDAWAFVDESDFA